jgi:hypothetical protein
MRKPEIQSPSLLSRDSQVSHGSFYERGPSWPKSDTGGASAALRYRQGANRGLQGLRFAPRPRVGVEFTPLKPENGHLYSSQCWHGFPMISGLENGKTATVKFG